MLEPETTSPCTPVSGEVGAEAWTSPTDINPEIRKTNPREGLHSVPSRSISTRRVRIWAVSRNNEQDWPSRLPPIAKLGSAAGLALLASPIVRPTPPHVHQQNPADSGGAIARAEHRWCCIIWSVLCTRRCHLLRYQESSRQHAEKDGKQKDEGDERVDVG